MNIKNIYNAILSYLDSFNKFRYYFKGYTHLKKLFKFASRTNLINKTIVFNTVRRTREFIDREFFLGKIFALNGAKVFILLDDGILEQNKKQKKDFIHNILFEILIKRALKIYKDPNLKICYYSKIIDETDIQCKNLVKLKKFAHSSTIRHFQNSVIDFKNNGVKRVFISHMKTAVLSRSAGEYVLKKIKPDFFITSHGIYSTWGPAYEYLKNTKVKSLVYAISLSHSKDPQDIYFTDTKVQTLSRCTFWEKYMNIPVSHEMEEKVNNLFEERISHRTKDTKLYYQGKLGSYLINKQNGFKYHIAIFPSLVWDGDIADRHFAFKGVLDWLISTIDYLKNRTDVRIFLKFHPAEVSTFKKSAKIQDLIQNYLKSEKIENLVLIPTESKIDPYEFLKSGVDFGICYDGILALEMLYLKIPVLLGGVKGRFSVDGGNYTIKTKAEYFNYLKNLDETIQNFHKNYDKYFKNIVRYTYWYIFENVIKLPVISKNNIKKIDLLQVKKEDIKLDKKLLDIFGRN